MPFTPICSPIMPSQFFFPSFQPLLPSAELALPVPEVQEASAEAVADRGDGEGQEGDGRQLGRDRRGEEMKGEKTIICW